MRVCSSRDVVKLLLMDIDGTLFTSRRDLGGTAMLAALSNIFPQRSFSRDGVHLGGVCDPKILTQVAFNGGIGLEQLKQHLPEILGRYEEMVSLLLSRATKAKTAWVCPGVHELLHRASDSPNTCLGILSGNYESIGFAKLEAVGIDPNLFQVTAFGSDHEDRNALPGIALV
jgi:phosphoglycolate phosphatase-like HAD superfamily hydrolase